MGFAVGDRNFGLHYRDCGSSGVAPHQVCCSCTSFQFLC